MNVSDSLAKESNRVRRSSVYRRPRNMDIIVFDAVRDSARRRFILRMLVDSGFSVRERSSFELFSCPHDFRRVGVKCDACVLASAGELRHRCFVSKHQSNKQKTVVHH
jgi:hypothetical protein